MKISVPCLYLLETHVQGKWKLHVRYLMLQKKQTEIRNAFRPF